MAQYKTREREDLKKIFTWSPKLSEPEITNLHDYLRHNHDVNWINGTTVTETEGNILTVSDGKHTARIELIGDNSMAMFTIDNHRFFNFLVFKNEDSFEIYSPFTKSSMFGLQLRREPDIDSSLGYGATNLDYVWVKMKSWNPMVIENYMLIEEKTNVNFTEHQISGFQDHIFKHLHNLLCKDPLYKGIHIIQFSKTTTDNGNVYINGGLVHKSTFLRFLRFESPWGLYKNYFEKKDSIERQITTDYDLKNPYDIFI